jgi:hypothetical protein
MSVLTTAKRTKSVQAPIKITTILFILTPKNILSARNDVIFQLETSSSLNANTHNNKSLSLQPDCNYILLLILSEWKNHQF